MPSQDNTCCVKGVKIDRKAIGDGPADCGQIWHALALAILLALIKDGIPISARACTTSHVDIIIENGRTQCAEI